MSQLRFCWLSLPLICSLQAAHAATPISGNVSGQTLAAGTWQVTGTLQVDQGTTLNLEAGAILKFNPGTQLFAYGTVVANGSEAERVVFTSRDDNTRGEILPDSEGSPAPGDWDGLYLYGYSSNEGSAQLTWAVVAWGGGPGNPATANVYAYYSDTVQLDHCEVLGSAAHGLFTDQASPVVTGSLFGGNGQHGLYTSAGSPQVVDNNFVSNGGWGAYLNQAYLQSIAGNNGSGNGVNGLGLSGDLYVNASWSHPDDGFPLILAGNTQVTDDVTLTLPAGTLVKAGEQVQLLVYGSLLCPGTAAHPVRFTSLKDDSRGGDTNGDGLSAGQPGDWLGIQAYGYSGNDGQLDLDWTELHHGGGISGGQGGIYLVYSDATMLEDCTVASCSGIGLQGVECGPQLVRSTFRDNGQHGLFVSGSSQPLLTDNRFDNNHDWGAYLYNVPLADYSGNDGSGNGVNGLGLSGNLYTSASWLQSDPAFPFILAGSVTVHDEVTLTLPAGTLVKAADQVQLVVYGSLVCPGTAAEPVRFVSLKEDGFGGDTNGDGPSSGQPGDWIGIQAYGYSSNNGIVDWHWTELHHGGGTGGGQGGLYLIYSDLALLEDCTLADCSASGLQAAECSPTAVRSTFRDNLDHGLVASGNVPVVLQDNLFLDNQDWGAYLSSILLGDFSGNTGSGNGINGLGLGGNLYGTATWSHPDAAFPFILNGPTQIVDGGYLTLPAGTVVKVTDQVQLTVYGRLDCMGSAIAPVRMVSLKDDSVGGDTNGDGPSSGSPGDWVGIQGYGYSSAQGILDLEYLELHHGGGAGASQGGLYLIYSDSAVLDNCTIGHCSASGLQVAECSPVVHASAFVGNLHHGLYASGNSAPVLTANQFLGNQMWGAYLAGCYLTGFSGNGGSGNAIDGLGLYGSVLGDATWSSTPGFPFVLAGDVLVSDGYSLGLSPGTVCKGQPSGRFYVYGRLNATGLPSAPVLLTSLADDSVDGDTGGDGPSPALPGGWMGIQLYGYSSSQGIANLSWCYLDHAGNGQAALLAQYSDQVSVSHSRILNSGGNGLQADYCSFSMDHSLIVLNQGSGVFHNGYTATLGSCTGDGGGNCFLFNAGSALYNNTTSPIEACGNFWGSEDPGVIDGMIFDDEENGSSGAVDFSSFSTTGCNPVITSITVVDGVVTLQWLAVPGASSYRIESSTAPWSGFTEDTSGVIAGFTWMAPQPLANTNYRVVALFD